MKNYLLPAVGSHGYLVVAKKKLSSQGKVCGSLPHDVLVVPCILSDVTVSLGEQEEYVSANVVLALPEIATMKSGDETDQLLRSIGGQTVYVGIPGVNLFESKEEADSAAAFFAKEGLIISFKTTLPKIMTAAFVPVSKDDMDALLHQVIWAIGKGRMKMDCDGSHIYVCPQKCWEKTGRLSDKNLPQKTIKRLEEQGFLALFPNFYVYENGFISDAEIFSRLSSVPGMKFSQAFQRAVEEGANGKQKNM